MSKPVHITEKLIFGAADRLLNNGVPIVEITNNMIRKEIGGTGSFANIQPLLREWKQKQVASRGESIEMPDSFKETVSNFSAQLWKLAAIATEEKVYQQYADYHRIKRDLDDVSQTIDEMDKELSDSKNTISELYKHLLKLKEDVNGNKQALQVISEAKEYDKYVNVTSEKMSFIIDELEKILGDYLVTNIGIKTLSD